MARSLGKTITQMLQEMSSWELWYWRERNQTEYLGDERDDYRAARLEVSMEACLDRIPEGQSVRYVDRMPFYGKPKTAEEVEQEEAALAKFRAEREKGLAIAAENKRKREQEASQLKEVK